MIDPTFSDPAIKTEQFQHQREVYEAHRDASYFALFWEMGLGKSKMVLDVASHKFLKGEIKALIIVAPNAVYKNWITAEIPQHLAAPYVATAYPKSKTDRSYAKKLVFLDPEFAPDRLKIITISFNSLCTVHGFQFLHNIAIMYPTMIVLDESTAIKKHRTVSATNAKKIRKNCSIAWICTGTPAAQSPFDLHSQIEFLNEDFWGAFGLKTLSAFKSRFGLYEFRNVGIKQEKNVPVVAGYKDLSILQKILKPISSRLLKENSVVKLPPKMYQTITFEMTPEQRSLYNTLKYKYQAELDDGVYLEAPLAIVRLTRLQQIASGFVTVEHEIDQEDVSDYADTNEYYYDDELKNIKIIHKQKEVRNIIKSEENPRLQVLQELLDEANHKVIVWCRFTRDVELITQMLGDRGIRYDGKVNTRLREEGLARFKDPADSAQVLIANVNAISQGVTLTIAKTMIYYSNSFSLEKRLQSEDRNHRIGQDSSVLIIDLAADNSVDDRIISCLKNKFEIAAQVTGDKLRDWIQ